MKRDHLDEAEEAITPKWTPRLSDVQEEIKYC
jgi:hypothetical protein